MNPRNTKTISSYNHRFTKTYNPNYEPWCTIEELLSAIEERTPRNSQNGSAKGE